MLPPDLVSILTWTEVVPLLLALAGSFMTVYACCTSGNWCHQWSSPLGTCLLLFCNPLQQRKGLCVGGLFSVLALAACNSLPFSWLLNPGWWQDTCRLVVLELQHFACQWPFFHNLCILSLEQGSCVYWEGVDRCSWGMVHMTSAALDHVPGRCGIQCVLHCLHTLQPHLIQQHNMFCRSLVDAIPSCHSWPSEVACAAWCWHLGLPKSACIELWILLQYHCHHWFVPCRWVGISDPLAHRWICQTSLWCLPAHRHGLMGRFHHLMCFLFSLRTSWSHSCVLHLSMTA